MLKASVVDADILSATKDTVVLLDFEGGQRLKGWLASKNKELGDELARAMAAGDFNCKDNQIFMLYGKGKVPPLRLVFAGLGKKEDFKPNKIRTASASVVNSLRLSGVKELAFPVDPSHNIKDQASYAVSVVEACMLAHHRYEVHKTEKEASALASIVLAAPGRVKDLAPAAHYAWTVASKTILCRDLVNTAASDKPPRVIAEYVRKHAGKHVRVAAFMKKDLQRMGAGGILAVNRGSTNEPCLLVMDYNPAKKGQACVALVGKGIVFDSGGLDIKGATNMETMKGDMGGAACVIHAVLAAAELALPIRVVGVCALTENSVGPDAYKPGDFVKTMSGKTVEILNTDAEGRMVLADALHHAKTFKPDFLIDVATLTGACWIALGSDAAGLFSNHQGLADQLVKAGQDTYERVWPMPMFDEYGEYIKSDFADLKNVVSNAPSGAGAITAAKFLESFVDKKQPWAHVDIAGVDWMEAEKDFRPKGATGFGVRLLMRFLTDLRKA